MADNSKIEWTDATWNPVTGCSVVSPGCTHCYAMRLAGTRLQHHPSRKGLTVDSKTGPVWNGKVRLNREWVKQPLSWTKPRMIFVCAHGDLFHEGVPDDWIDRVFAVMALSPQHTFQVLTKRSSRMRKYLASEERRYQIELEMYDLGGDQDARTITDDCWPLPNVWLGVSAERQQEAEQRIPDLLHTLAACHFVSAEPLLGPIDLDALVRRFRLNCSVTAMPRGSIDWVIAGGESGFGARPMHPDWARALRDQCAAAGVPYFFKQWGAWSPLGAARPVVISASSNTAWPDGTIGAGDEKRNGGPGQAIYPATKAIAGRLLDGVEHNGMPQRK